MTTTAAQSLPTDDADAATRASGSSFYTAMRILPRPQRQAMFEIYSFCRQVDDIADDPGVREVRLQQLQRWRDDLAAIYSGQTPARHAGLAAAVRAFKLEHADFLAVIDGMEMDVLGPIRAPDMATLDLYCDRVASAVGRLSVKVFGMNAEDGIALAHHLGRALQLTNILRDIDEDAEIGRLYLPKEALEAAGITTTEPELAVGQDNVGFACAPLVARARTHFAAADAIMARSPRATVKAPRIMGEAYKLYLDGLIARGWRAPRVRVRISRLRLLWIILRHALI